MDYGRHIPEESDLEIRKAKAISANLDQAACVHSRHISGTSYPQGSFCNTGTSECW